MKTIYPIVNRDGDLVQRYINIIEIIKDKVVAFEIEDEQSKMVFTRSELGLILKSLERIEKDL